MLKASFLFWTKVSKKKERKKKSSQSKIKNFFSFCPFSFFFSKETSLKRNKLNLGSSFYCNVNKCIKVRVPESGGRDILVQLGIECWRIEVFYLCLKKENTVITARLKA